MQTYKVNETFYSLKGEGEWTGAAMFFIRLSGCNLHCSFCDTNYEEFVVRSVDELVDMALQHPARKVVITGGEPLMQDTQPLVVALRKEGFKCHLETNGTLMTHHDWDWVAVSPKTHTLQPTTVYMANEFKFLCGIEDWELLMDDVMERFKFHPVKADAPTVWLMPLAKAWPHRDYAGLLDHNIQQAVAYCLAHPRVKLCMQMHKCAGIR